MPIHNSDITENLFKMAGNTGNLGYMRIGIGQARRGWLEADDVLNTRSWKELRKMLVRA
ncbi:MAG: hypothetical protein PVI06_16010 [Desulfobacterales bacterium]|jgi:DNA polymerase (family 10)